jgi:hypothetical protein
MAYYLQMDGTSNYLKLPSLTLNRIVFDGVIRRRTDANRVVWDFRTGISFSYILQQTNGADAIGSGSVKVNGGSNVTNNTAFIPNGTRCTIEHTFSTTAADDGNIFSNSSGQASSVIDGDIYDIKIYNGATLVAHYDMTLGNVQDQSGNGRHATLTGGTWVSDGGSGTEYPVNLTDSISVTDTLSKRLNVIVADTVTTSENESDTANKSLTDSIASTDSFSSTRGKGVNLSDSIAITDSIRKALTKLRVDSVTLTDAATDRASIGKSFADTLTISESVTTFKGKSIVLSDNITVSDSINKAIGKIREDFVSSSDSLSRKTNVSLRLYDVIVTTETFSKTIPNAPTLIGTVRLKGRQNLRVYLIGRRDLTVRLRGGIKVTAENQKFKMTAGDSKIIEVPIEDMADLTGITAKYAMKKSIYSADSDLFKDTTSGITVDVANKQLIITLSPTDTQNLSGDYLHEVEITDQSGNVSTIMTGTVTIRKSGV